MTIGDVFARAWDLWRRDVGWLVLAGLVVGLIMAVIFAIALGILGAIFAGAGLTISADMADNTTGSLSGLGVGMLVAGFIVYAVAMFLVQVLGMTFYGGMFEMVVGAYKGSRTVVFGDLFSGFRKFGSYALYAVVLFGISIGLNLLNILPVIGAIIAFVVGVWITVIWIYVLPLIADQGLGFGEAASRSNQMVKGAGWWWTFGMVILLGLAALAAVIITVLVAWGVYQGSDVAGIMIGLLLFLVFAVLFPPYAICYVSVLYIASGGDVAVAAAPAGGLPGIPPAPPAPPAYGPPARPTYGTPTSPTWGGSAPGAPGVTAPVAPPPAGAEAWKAAADPLAGQPPAPPLRPAQSTSPPAPPADQAATPADQAVISADEANAANGGAAADDAQTAVTDAAAEAPRPPEPPAPPAPPAPAPPGGGV